MNIDAEFEVGQSFLGIYPPEVALWCNENDAHIEKVNGLWTIVANPAPEVTIADLVEFLYKEKCKVAYGGVKVIKGGRKYLFETNQDSITMCNSMALAMVSQPDDYTVTWKVWQDESPVMLTITKAEFNAIFAFGMLMINTAFGIEGALNEQAQGFSTEQLADEDYVLAFKEVAITQLSMVDSVYSLDTASQE